MKIVHISASDMGGAGVAAKRLHLALLNKGIDSTFLTLFKVGKEVPGHFLIQTGESKNIFNRLGDFIKNHISLLNDDLRKYYLKNAPKGFDRFSFPYSKFDIHHDQRIKNADIIHLHWVADGMIDFRRFFENVNKPVVWTLHDMNPFTGGCHHSDGCFEFTQSCVNCLQVKNTVDEYIAARNLSYKLKATEGIPAGMLRIITPSEWLGQLSSKSRLFGRFRHDVIPNLNETEIFQPVDKQEVRKKESIDARNFVVLFVANDIPNPRKGINTLVESLNRCTIENLLVVTVGNEMHNSALQKPLRQYGFVTDKKRMAELYSMADVFVLPSYAENFPNTIVESLLCGTPVVGSRVGGIPEQVTEKNGILVEPGNAEQLAKALEQMSRQHEKYQPGELRNEALEKYAPAPILDKHIDIYKEMLRT